MTPKKPILPSNCEAATSQVANFLRQVSPLLSSNTTLENFYACEPWDSFCRNADGSVTRLGFWGVEYKTDDAHSITAIQKLGEDLAHPVWIEDISVHGHSQRFYFILKLAMCGELEPDTNS